MTDGMKWAWTVIAGLVIAVVAYQITISVQSALVEYRMKLESCLAQGGNLIATNGSGPLCIKVQELR